MNKRETSLKMITGAAIGKVGALLLLTMVLSSCTYRYTVDIDATTIQLIDPAGLPLAGAKLKLLDDLYIADANGKVSIKENRNGTWTFILSEGKSFLDVIACARRNKQSFMAAFFHSSGFNSPVTNRLIPTKLILLPEARFIKDCTKQGMGGEETCGTRAREIMKTCDKS